MTPGSEHWPRSHGGDALQNDQGLIIKGSMTQKVRLLEAFYGVWIHS